MLVDTPGLGESKTLIKHVSRYLEKSFGFIYVVNSSNAGGVHEGRVSFHFGICSQKWILYRYLDIFFKKLNFVQLCNA